MQRYQHQPQSQQLNGDRKIAPSLVLSSCILAQFMLCFVQLNQIHLWQPCNHAVSYFELNYDDECDFMDFTERREATKKKPSLNVILCNFFFSLFALPSSSFLFHCCSWFAMCLLLLVFWLVVWFWLSLVYDPTSAIELELLYKQRID